MHSPSNLEDVTTGNYVDTVNGSTLVDANYSQSIDKNINTLSKNNDNDNLNGSNNTPNIDSCSGQHGNDTKKRDKTSNGARNGKNGMYCCRNNSNGKKLVFADPGWSWRNEQVKQIRVPFLFAQPSQCKFTLARWRGDRH